MQTLFVKDGEDFLVVAEVQTPSVTDPAGQYPAVGHAFRVIANTYGPTLKLVPLTEQIPAIISDKLLENKKGKQ